ncbi:serine phosphatase RsbU (regulator of sigma subunit)/CHASE3 domain sensor protein/anti-sigma regulatory factor (Ser/Thr protein kinase) [Streptomyces sp. V4I23]|uniref:SpoIIE family protein phosphatase n=1 Tax=Streptomyces sp. V4I23 TaxID=3042282 RepID=UPI00277DC2BE|nr:SpoIIE family protein phosphatase [Streptomyces sp. V4I23]MDQ1010791.1 serine phosphatase RsbU (regulator of sigma subunit)/CHASE3 domain sensor protein/anti-sigma regulatory factor (Ser/Thr protein kinase) [Streptomyces sp. V4I23]
MSPRWGLVPLTAAAGGLLAVIIGIAFGVVLWAINDARESMLATRNARVALTRVGMVEEAVLDLESGQRRFLITRQEQFLEPWRAARSSFPGRAQQLVDVSTSPAQRELAEQIRQVGRAFIDDYSVPLVDAARRGEPGVSSVTVTLRGVQRIDELMGLSARYTAAERSGITTREAGVAADLRRATVAGSIGVGVSILVIVAYGGWVTRTVVWPVRRAAGLATRLAAGDLSARMPRTGKREIGQLETAFNTMAGSLENTLEQAEAAHRRLRLLYDAGMAVGTTLDVRRTADELVKVSVPRFADFVTVDLDVSVLRGGEPAQADGVAMRRVARGGVWDDAPLDPVGALLEPVAPFSTNRRTGAALLPDLRSAPTWWAPDPQQADRFLEYGMHSLITAPLFAQGVLMGAVTFWRSHRSPPFAQDDLSGAEELAAKAAVATDNARRYTRERETALTLQRSLLPQRLPEQPAVDFAYRYLPTGTEAGVGGDWLDVIPLSGTRVALVVGDVVGHGVHASAAMGRLRTAVRTLADVDLSPDELLTHLDDLVIHLTEGDSTPTGEVGSTCLYAVYDPISRRFCLASAGHPLPLLITPQGAVEPVPGDTGPPLGVGGLPFETTELDLAAGSTLALFSDGLVRSRHFDLDHGLERLRRTLAFAGESLEATCDRVVETSLTDHPDDDVTLLLARTRALPTDQVVTWDVPVDPEHVGMARTLATEQLDAWQLAELSFITELVVSELVTNAIRHGGSPIQLRLIRDTALICEVSDGSSTAPHLRRARVFDEGGRGLLLVAQLTQRWGTRYTTAGKTIWCEQTLPAAEP